jgi:quinol monooxygenase YgiN
MKRERQMVITVLDMTLSSGQEADTARALQAVCDATRACPGCLGGGVFQQVGRPAEILYLEIWNEAEALEAHIRSREFERLLAILETSPVPPSLTFRFVAETRGLAWVEELRLHSREPA